MSNIDNGFAVEILSLNDQTLLTSGTSDPRLVGYEAPEGSLFSYKNGIQSDLLIKTGPLDTDWVVHIGYTGSQGPIGYTGSQGIQGVIGFTGSVGNVGFTGSQGTTGGIGFTGSQGNQGGIGFTGSQGIQGIQGFTGSAGYLGSAGYVGSRGANGFTGSQGVIGYTGSQGIQGVIGFTGSAGYVGSQGVTGYNGSAGFAVLTDLNDVTITAPTANQVLYYTGTEWVNSNGTATSASGILSTWTLISGNRYYADFNHGLGTNDVVISLFNNTTNQLVFADSIVETDINTVRVTVVGNTIPVRIVVVANGMVTPQTLSNVANSLQVINAGGSPSIQQDLVANRPAAGTAGRLFLSTDTKILFRDNGTTWDVLTSSQGVIRTLTYFANSLDSPTNSNFAITGIAPTVSDPTNPALNVRSFVNTSETGVSFMITPPLGATVVTFNIKARAGTAPGTAAAVQPRIYLRSIPNNGAISAWSAATDFATIVIPTNTNYQYNSQSFTLASLGLTVGTLYQFELSRKTTVATGTNLASPWYMVDLTIEFT